MTTQTTLLIALVMTAAIASHAHAGMSGTSARVQEIAKAEAEAQAQAKAQPKAQARPQAPAAAPRSAPEPQAAPSGGRFDGSWAVSTSPGCGLAARSSVEVIGGRISAPSLSGNVDSAGNVRTVARGGGLSVISTGRISPTTGSGTYRVSNGCTGTWTSSKV
jgi:hypothetical protein